MSEPRRIPPSSRISGLASYGGDDFRKHAKRRGNSVELTAAVIGNDDGGGAVVDGAASIVGRENAFCDDRAGPEFAEPAKIFPGDDSATERGADVDERHGAFAGNDDVGERRSAAVEEKGSEPTGTREKLRDVGKFREERPAEKFFMPLRGSRSRSPATGVSMVTTRALKPAFLARSMACSAMARPPTK